MRIPLTDYEINSIRDALYEEPMSKDCDKCVKWSKKMYTDLRNGNFDLFKKDVMHFVNHIQSDEKDRYEQSD